MTFGLPCSWTQILSKVGAFNGDPEGFRRLSLALLSLRYDTTFFTYEDAVWAAEAVKWNLSAPPFAAVVECFTRPTIATEPLLGLAGVLLKAVWSNPLYGFQATVFTQWLLDCLGHRESGYQLVLTVNSGIDGLFGLHVTAAANVRRIIENWIAVNGSRRIILL
jgi:hypothetical protein